MRVECKYPSKNLMPFRTKYATLKKRKISAPMQVASQVLLLLHTCWLVFILGGSNWAAMLISEMEFMKFEHVLFKSTNSIASKFVCSVFSPWLGLEHMLATWLHPQVVAKRMLAAKLGLWLLIYETLLLHSHGRVKMMYVCMYKLLVEILLKNVVTIIGICSSDFIGCSGLNCIYS